MNNSHSKKKQLLFFISLLLLYVILFEFVLPVNKILPKPSLLMESYVSLFEHYSLFQSFIVSASVVYVSLFIGYLTVSFLAGSLIKLFINDNKVFTALKIFRYFPAFFYAVIFAFWFPDSIVAEYFFGLIAAFFYLGLTIKIELPNVKKEYLDAAAGLGIPESKIQSGVIWKCIQPNVFDSLNKLHYYLWVLVMLFEFIGRLYGFGGLYYTILEFQDFAALFALAIFISIIIMLGSWFLNLLKEKLIYWQP